MRVRVRARACVCVCGQPPPQLAYISETDGTSAMDIEGGGSAVHSFPPPTFLPAAAGDRTDDLSVPSPIL